MTESLTDIDIRKPDSEIPPWYDNFFVNGIPFRKGEQGGEQIYKYKRVAVEIPSLKIRDSDLFLVTYPRGGTHWMKFILGCVFSDGDFERVRDTTLNDQVQYLDIDEGAFGEQPDEDQFCRWEKKTSKRMFNTHLDWTLVPPGVREGKCKVIMMIRNPKDSFVSMYNWMIGKTETLHFEGSFDEFFKSYLEGKISWGGADYFSFMRKWINQRNDIPMLIVHFEDMKRDPPTEIRRMAEFLDRPLSDEDVNTIATLCGFESMKDYKCVASLEEYLDKKDVKFMRKGVVGDWKNTFTVAQSEEIDRKVKELEKDTGYTIKME